MFVVACCVLLACGAARAGPTDSCAALQDYLALAEEVELPQDGHADGASVCGGACCSARREMALRARARREFSSLAAHTTRALHGLLATTRHTVRDHVMELSKQSHNKTQILFTQVYKNMATHAHRPIDELYSDIRSYVDENITRSDLEGGGGARGINLEESTARFFRDVFPLVFHEAAAQDWRGRDFTPDYKNCLREAYSTIAPFGDIPRQIAAELGRSLTATRALLAGLRAAGEVLAESEELLAEEWGGGAGACRAALLRMSHCSKCRGVPLQVKPCAGYCLNVLRGCVTWRVAELDAPWNAFVEAAQRLVTEERGSDGRAATGDAALRPLDARVSEAIMHAIENGANLERK